MGDRRDWAVDGARELPEAESVAAAAAAVLAEAPPRFVLGGYSMGGRVALEAACQAPSRVLGLLLVSSTAGIEDAEARAARRALDAERAAAYVADPAAFLEAWYAAPMWGDLRAHPGYAAMRARRGDARHGRTLRALSSGGWAPRWGDLPRLEMPTIWLAGSRDAKYCALASRGAGAMPQGEARVVEGAGHALLVEARELVLAALAELEGVGGIDRPMRG